MNKDYSVLIVIDHQNDRQLIANELQTRFKIENIEQTHAPSNAYNTLKGDKKFDLVICDLDLPKLSGIDFIKKARELPNTQKTDYILTSSRKDKESLLAAAAVGVKDFILRPTNSETIVARFTKYFKTYAARSTERVAFFEAFTAIIHFADSDKALYKGTLMDLSLGGCLVSAELFKNGGFIYDTANITIDVKEAPIKLQGRLLRLESNSDSPERTHIKAAFKFLEAEKSALKQLSALISESKSTS